eukprot:symbB.v1.2.005781.t1/scaffold289.1/size287290/26
MVLLGHVLHTRQPFTGKQLRALFFCWLSLHSHVLGSPLVSGGTSSGIRGPSEPHENAVFAAPNAMPSTSFHKIYGEAPCVKLGAGLGMTVYTKATKVDAIADADTRLERRSQDDRRLQQLAAPYPFFTTPPYVNVVVFDSHDSNCDVNFESPPVTDPTLVGYPADGTDSLRQAHMACGVAPARFVFTTSNLTAYEDQTIAAKMQIRITCARALFVESPTCENVLDATGNFPRIEECRFNEKEARLILQTRLMKESTYSMTLKLLMPSGRMTAAENSYVFTTEFDPDDIIEGTKSSIDLGYTVPHAKDPTYGDDFTSRGYITGFFWQPVLTYESTPDTLTIFTFGLRTFGHMNTDYNIDIVAHPTNVWKIGVPGTDCQQPPHIGTTCRLRSFQGALASEANGFRLDVGTTPMVNLGSQATPQFSLEIRNPPSSVNMYWTATSFRIDEDQLPQEPFTVFIDKPINVMGTPTGRIVAFERGDVNVEQWLYSIGVRVRSIHVSNGVENVSVRMFWSCNAQRCSGKDICDSNCSNTELNFLAPPPIEEFELPRQSVAIPELRSEFVFENGEKYTGEWIGNERHGTGSHLWPNGARYDGQFRNNQANGDGTFRFPNGGVYEGQWKSDRAHGHGSYRHFDQASYDGQWRNDKQHGEGVELWPDGARFEGQHREGQKSGKGKLQWPDGSSYEGDFEANTLHGEGVYRWADGKEYSGQWAKDRMSGAGCFTWPDGRVYTGQYLDNQKHGHGMMRWPDGGLYEGQWVKGLQHGKGIHTSKTGNCAEGTWESGRFTGGT